MNENSILAVTNPFTLLAGVFLVCLVGFFCAKHYKNTNDFAKSVKLFLPTIVVVDIIIYLLFHTQIILILGLDICGFITLALVSNYYFYH